MTPMQRPKDELRLIVRDPHIHDRPRLRHLDPRPRIQQPNPDRLPRHPVELSAQRRQRPQLLGLPINGKTCAPAQLTTLRSVRVFRNHG